jgi:alpha-tubulin suppressor-like RCC1 family protein
MVPANEAPAGASVQMVAAAACSGSAGPRYRFSYHDSSTTTWTVFRNWNARPDATWNTSNVPSGDYFIGVEVRADDFNQGDAQDAIQVPYRLNGNCGTVTLSTSLPSPQPLGTAVDLSGLAICTSGSPEYKFSMLTPNDPTPVVLRDWAADRTFTLTGNEAGRVGLYALKVESRAVGSVSVQGTATQDFAFVALCDASGFNTLPASPAAVGTAVQVLAQAACAGAATPEFLLSYRPAGGATWTPFYGWGSPGLGNWDTTGLASGSYELRAEIRAVGDPSAGVSTVFLNYDLTCGPGYTTDLGGLCVDIDECALQTDDCDPLVTCTNTPGSFTCSGCPPDTIDVDDAGSVCTTFAQAEAGWGHSCATTAHGQLYCWGDNHSGQLGDGTTTHSSVPVHVGNASDWDSVVAGYYASCGLRSGSLYCWGWNAEGQLGVGTTTDSLVPVQVGTATDWDAIDLGYYHGCGLRSGSLYCWGWNGDGELGDGTTTDSPTPVQVGSATDWTQLAIGGYHGCGTRGGSLYCWGWNGKGQLGIATTVNSSSPVQVGSASDWSYVASSAGHSCGIRGGSLYCWGNNQSKQLGDGTTTLRTAPVQVGTATDWSGVTAGAYHSCGTRAPGSLYCWGSNSQGQLGDGTNSPRATPVAVGTDTDWAAISGGDYHSCGSRGTDLYCWGLNDTGQLGDGTTTARNAPGTPLRF